MEQNKDKEITLKDDVIFKAFFARKGKEKYLKDFLSSILPIDIKEIRIKEEVNILQLNEKVKGGRIDLQAVLNNNEIVNIELQRESQIL